MTVEGIFTCSKCGFVAYRPFLRCPVCGNTVEGLPPESPKDKGKKRKRSKKGSKDDNTQC